MAEYKQYVSQEQENGSVMISEDVIATIAAHAIADVEGVVGITGKSGNDLAELINKKNWGRGMKVMISEDNSVAIDVNISICYGQSVVDVAQAVQAAVSGAVESMTGLKPTAVNVNVGGIVRK